MASAHNEQFAIDNQSKFRIRTMTSTTNEFDQPVGNSLPNWTPPIHPARETMIGRFCRVEPIEPDRHAKDLFDAIMCDKNDRDWTYLPYGPFSEFESYLDWMKRFCLSNDPLFFAVIDQASNKAVGVTSYLRITPIHGVIEVGHIYLSNALKKSPAATEAMFLMMKRAFELGYRRYEWKCDSLNAPSRAAARRLGFSYEGTFRQAIVYKGRNRDTAWFAITDSDWPMLQGAFLNWLDSNNFDDQGKQKNRLSELTAPVIKNPM